MLRKLESITEEDGSFEVLSELIANAGMFSTEGEFKAVLEKAAKGDKVSNGELMKSLKPIISNHKQELKHIFAVLTGIPDDEYKATAANLVKDFTALLSDPVAIQVFI